MPVAIANAMMTEGDTFGLSICWGPQARPEFVSPYSRRVLISIMKVAKVQTVWITSTYRDAHDDARAMEQNIRKTGVQKQTKLYRGKPGQQVVELYAREKTAIADAERRGIDTGLRNGFLQQQHLMGVMERRIAQLGPEKVSNHSGLQQVVNVFDVSPSMMVPPNTASFLAAAKNEPRVTHLIPPPKDPAFHFEICQLGDWNVKDWSASVA